MVPIKPFKDEYEAFKNIMEIMPLEDDFVPETVQELVAFMIENEYEFDGAPGTLIVNGKLIDEEDVEWYGVTAYYKIAKKGTYNIEMQYENLSFKGTVLINRFDNYVGKKVRYSGIDWTVMYDDPENGLQLVSNEALGDGVTLGGYETLEEAIKEYNKVNATLSAECSKLVTDKSKVIDIRNIGGLSEDKDEYISSEDFGYEWFNQYDGKIMTSDTGWDGLYYEDNRTLQNLGIYYTTDDYWFSVRAFQDYDDERIIFKVSRRGRDEYMIHLLQGQYFKEDKKTYKVRPVITMDSTSELFYNENEDRYEFTEEFEKVSHVGKKVKYSGMDWIVLYEDNGHGTQLICNEMVESIYLGSTTSTDEAINSYNKAIEILNTECANMVSDKSCVTQIRNVGGPATDAITTPNYTFSSNFFNDQSLYAQLDNKLKKSDNLYSEDYTKMQEIGILNSMNYAFSNSFWMASRYIKETEDEVTFNIRKFSPSGADTYFQILKVNKYGTVTPSRYRCNICPVITIDPTCKFVKISEDTYNLTK